MASSAHARYQSAPISGRLADKKSRQVVTLPANRLAARGRASGGVRIKRSKIPVDIYLTHHAHRRGIPSRLRSDVSPDDASSEVRTQDFNSVKIHMTRAFCWLSLLGLRSSATGAIPLGRLHMRHLQLHLLAHWRSASRNLKALVPEKHDLLDRHLRWWFDKECTRAGTLIPSCV